MSELQPLETFLDENHPANDLYMQGVEQTRRVIMSLSSAMRAKHVQILKLVFQGHNYQSAAAELNTTGSTVSRIVNSPKGRELLRALQYHQQLLEGPNLQQRRNMLWRIATKNELIDPALTIKAVHELNAMTYKDWEKDGVTGPKAGNAPAQVSIIINQDQLPRTTLDGELE